MEPVEDTSQTSLFDDNPGQGDGGKNGNLREEVSGETLSDDDPLVRQAAMLVRAENAASIGLIQRRMNVSYTKAKELLDALERQGVVGPFNGSMPREVLPWDAPADEGNA